MDYSNRQIGRYRFLSRAAQGGFAEIWRAQPLDNNKIRFAVKILKEELSADRKAAGLLEREWKIVRKLSHPRMIKYHEFGYFNDLPYLVMDWFDGVTLRGMLGESAQKAQRVIGPLFESVCQSLSYIHSHGIVHRDIKPENILVGESGEARLIDFSNSHTFWQRLLHFGSKIDGTPTYMSPEQIEGKRTCPQSDIYALGAVLFEILAGRPPFVGDNANEIRQQHLRAAPVRLSRLNGEVTSALDKLVANMLAKNPAQRPQTVEQVLQRFKTMSVFVQV